MEEIQDDTPSPNSTRTMILSGDESDDDVVIIETEDDDLEIIPPPAKDVSSNAKVMTDDDEDDEDNGELKVLFQKGENANVRGNMDPVLYNSCNDKLKPVIAALKYLDTPNPNSITKKQQALENSRCLFQIGCHIEKCLKEYRKDKIQLKLWDSHLWAVAARYTGLSSKQLRKLFKEKKKYNKDYAKTSRKNKPKNKPKSKSSRIQNKSRKSKRLKFSDESDSNNDEDQDCIILDRGENVFSVVSKDHSQQNTVSSTTVKFPVPVSVSVTNSTIVDPCRMLPKTVPTIQPPRLTFVIATSRPISSPKVTSSNGVWPSSEPSRTLDSPNPRDPRLKNSASLSKLPTKNPTGGCVPCAPTITTHGDPRIRPNNINISTNKLSNQPKSGQNSTSTSANRRILLKSPAGVPKKAQSLSSIDLRNRLTAPNPRIIQRVVQPRFPSQGMNRMPHNYNQWISPTGERFGGPQNQGQYGPPPPRWGNYEPQPPPWQGNFNNNYYDFSLPFNQMYQPPFQSNIPWDSWQWPFNEQSNQNFGSNYNYYQN